MPTPNVRNQAADQDIAEMFRNRGQEPPKIIPREEAEATRAEVLEARKTGRLPNLKDVPKDTTKPQQPKPAPKQPVSAKIEPRQEKAVTPYWQPCGEDAQRYHRWKLSGTLSMILGWVISLFWWALRAGDATVRLACPIIILCHLAIGALLLWAWLGR